MLTSQEKEKIIKAVSELSDEKIDEVLRLGDHKIEIMQYKIKACQGEKWNRSSRKGGNVNR